MTPSTPAPQGREPAVSDGTDRPGDGHWPDVSDGTDPTSEARIRIVMLPEGDLTITGRVRFGGPTAIAVGGPAVTLALGAYANVPSSGTVMMVCAELVLAGALGAVKIIKNRKRRG